MSFKRVKLFTCLVSVGFLTGAAEIHAAVSTTAYDYALQAGTVTVTDANNKRLRQYYDDVNRLSQVELLDATGVPSFTFEYDETDQIERITYPGGEQRFRYDEFDRLQSLTDFGIPDLLNFSYDHQDRLTGITYGSNGSVCYQYDPDGRLTRVGRIPAGQTAAHCGAANVEKTDYTYDIKGRLKTRTYPNGIQSYWDYDPDTGLLKELGHKRADGSLIYSDTFFYVPNTTLYQRIAHTTAQGVKGVDYGYDAYQRLTLVTEADGRRTAYTYDPFGNRTQEHITNITNPNATGGAPKAYGNYRYAYTGNRLHAIHYTPPGGAETVLEQYSYDRVGRITERRHATAGQTTYTWDDRGYLIQVTQPGATISYTYDALGQRKTKTVDGVTTRYVTAPIFGLSHVLMELDSNNAIRRTYLYGGHTQLSEEPNPAQRSADRYLLQGGSVANITHAVNSAGVVENAYGYDAFGLRTTIATAGATTRHGYTGEQYDEETGLLYLRARYYDPAIGRFISVDPYLGRLEEPGTQNRFVYVKNNPLGFVDPLGLDTTGTQSCLTLSVVYQLSYCLASHSDSYKNAFVEHSVNLGKTSDTGIDLSFVKINTNAPTVASLMGATNISMGVTGNVHPLIGATSGEIFSTEYKGNYTGYNISLGKGISADVSTSLVSQTIAERSSSTMSSFLPGDEYSFKNLFNKYGFDEASDNACNSSW